MREPKLIATYTDDQRDIKALDLQIAREHHGHPYTVSVISPGAVEVLEFATEEDLERFIGDIE